MPVSVHKIDEWINDLFDLANYYGEQANETTYLYHEENYRLAAARAREAAKTLINLANHIQAEDLR